MKDLIISLTGRLHFLIFRQTMGANMQKFLSNFSWSVMGMGTFSIIMLLINILAGRLIGPEGYGKYNLILSISQILIIPVILGLDSASILAIASSKTLEGKTKNISSAFWFITATTGILILCSILFYAFIQRWLDQNTNLFLLLLLPFTVLLAFKTILDGFIRGLSLFKLQFFFRLIEIFTAVILFIFFFLIIKRTAYTYYLLSLIGSTFILVILYLNKLKSLLVNPDFTTLKKLLAYGKILTIGTISGVVFGSLDKFIVAKYLSIPELGIYSAYYTAASFISINIIQLFLNVFFPTIVKIKDKFLITKKINRLAYIFFIPGIIFSSLVVFAAIKLFGAQYRINIYYIISFSTLGILQIIFSIYHSIITATSKNLFKKYLLYINIFSLLYAGVCVVVILFKMLTIQSMINVLIMYVFGAIIIQKRLLHNPSSYTLEASVIPT